jgi:hypothetical protein
VPSSKTLNGVDYYHVVRAIIDAVVYQFTGKNIDEVLGDIKLASPLFNIHSKVLVAVVAGVTARLKADKVTM